jgi:hypothetical protein
VSGLYGCPKENPATMGRMRCAGFRPRCHWWVTQEPLKRYQWGSQRICLAIRVARKLKAIDVIDVLSDLFILRGIPAHIRSDNGPEFVVKAVQDWIAVAGAKTAYRTEHQDQRSSCGGCSNNFCSKRATLLGGNEVGK